MFIMIKDNVERIAATEADKNRLMSKGFKPVEQKQTKSKKE